MKHEDRPGASYSGLKKEGGRTAERSYKTGSTVM